MWLDWCHKPFDICLLWICLVSFFSPSLSNSLTHTLFIRFSLCIILLRKNEKIAKYQTKSSKLLVAMVLQLIQANDKCSYQQNISFSINIKLNLWANAAKHLLDTKQFIDITHRAEVSLHFRHFAFVNSHLSLSFHIDMNLSMKYLTKWNLVWEAKIKANVNKNGPSNEQKYKQMVGVRMFTKGEKKMPTNRAEPNRTVSNIQTEINTSKRERWCEHLLCVCGCFFSLCFWKKVKPNKRKNICRHGFDKIDKLIPNMYYVA